MIIKLQELIDAASAAVQEPPRPHLGCSIIGHPCDRWLWLSFRWAVIEQFDGRILRLFARGQREEAVVIKSLGSIGIVFIVAGNDGQARVDFGNHICGSIDGIAVSGVPGNELEPHIVEIKTHSLKSFNTLIKDGVKAAKYQHYIQMQLYMLGTDIKNALYVAVCKDDDRIHGELVSFDGELAHKHLTRAHDIVSSAALPGGISNSASWHECKYCAASGFCHSCVDITQINCRTCAYSVPQPDSSWYCSHYEAENIPLDTQRTGCEAHQLHPHLSASPF